MRLMFRRGRHEGDDRPTHPIYSDQRKFGLTLALRSKLFLAVLTFMVVTLAGETLYLLHLHSQGVKDRTQLACLLVEDTPPGNQLGDEVRAKYHCPAYNPNRQRTTPPTISPPATVTPPAPTTPRARPSKPSARPTPGTTATVTHVHTQPTTRTVTPPGKTVTRTKTQKPPPPASSTSQLCGLLPIVCQLPVP